MGRFEVVVVVVAWIIYTWRLQTEIFDALFSRFLLLETLDYFVGLRLMRSVKSRYYGLSSSKSGTLRSDPSSRVDGNFSFSDPPSTAES